MAAKWVLLNYCEPLEQVAAAQRRGQPAADLRKRPIDPTDAHLVPWQSGLTGIAYNPTWSAATSPRSTISGIPS